MKKFNKKFKVGTRVLLENHSEFLKIISINDTRVNIKVEGMAGSYQVGHVVKFSNRLA